MRLMTWRALSISLYALNKPGFAMCLMTWQALSMSPYIELALANERVAVIGQHVLQEHL
jgi:hypothetical protein